MSPDKGFCDSLFFNVPAFFVELGILGTAIIATTKNTSLSEYFPVFGFGFSYVFATLLVVDILIQKEKYIHESVA